MPNRRSQPERATQDRRRILPQIPGTSGFVPVHIIADALSHVLALALHRDAWGNTRAGHSSRLLATALRDGAVECDPLLVRWTPPPADAASHLREAWGTKTGHEGEHHRQLRAAAVGLLAAWAPGAEIGAERPRSGRGRRVRPDLEVRAGRRGVILAEVGAVEGDAIAALLLPGPGVRDAPGAAQVTHVAVLPFPGRRAGSARGYTFRLAGQPALASPSRMELRRAWSTFARRPRLGWQAA
jgi:hypothetical protein